VPQPQPAPLRRAITPQPGIPFKSPPLSFRHLDDDLKYLPAQRTASRGSSLHQTIPTMVYQHPPPPPHLAEQIHPTLEYPVRPSFVYGGSLIVDDQNDTASSTVPAADSIPIVSSQQNATLSTAKTLNFEPFIAAIKRARRSDEKQILRTDVGAHLSKADYEAIGLMGLKQTAQAAVTAGVIVTGGSENSAWIGLPEWFNPRLDDDLATARLTEPVASNRPPGDVFAPLISVLMYTHDHLKYDRPLVDKFVAALVKRYPDYLAKANCRSFFEYAALAEKEGVVVQGGTLDKAWIALKREGVVRWPWN